jgi:hypothetical protein
MILGLALSGIPSAVIERPLAAEVFLPTSLIITAALSLLVRTEQSLLAPLGQFARPSSLAWALLPLAAVFVAVHVQGGGSTLWMVTLLAVISATPLLLLVRRPNATECAVSLFSIALALAFQMNFILVGFDGDARLEVFNASQVLSAARWAPHGDDLYGSMLSVTTLPAVFFNVGQSRHHFGLQIALQLRLGIDPSGHLLGCQKSNWTDMGYSGCIPLHGKYCLCDDHAVPIKASRCITTVSSCDSNGNVGKADHNW